MQTSSGPTVRLLTIAISLTFWWVVKWCSLPISPIAKLLSFLVNFTWSQMRFAGFLSISLKFAEFFFKKKKTPFRGENFIVIIHLYLFRSERAGGSSENVPLPSEPQKTLKLPFFCSAELQLVFLKAVIMSSILNNFPFIAFIHFFIGFYHSEP